MTQHLHDQILDFDWKELEITYLFDRTKVPSNLAEENILQFMNLYLTQHQAEKYFRFFYESGKEVKKAN